MIEDPRTKLRFLTAGTVEQTVINDKCIYTFIVSQRLDLFIDDGSGKQRSKSQSVRFFRIQETIECVLRKSFPEGSGALLHVHAAGSKDVAKFISQN